MKFKVGDIIKNVAGSVHNLWKIDSIDADKYIMTLLEADDTYSRHFTIGLQQRFDIYTIDNTNVLHDYGFKKDLEDLLNE